MELKKGGLISIHFDSVIDLEEFDNSANPNKQFFEAIRDFRKSEHEWFGPTTNTTAESIEKSIIGDDELTNRYLSKMIEALNIELTLASLSNKAPITKRKRIKGDHGDYLDMQAVYQGKIDRAWTRTQKTHINQETKLINSVIDIAGNCNISAIDSLWTAASCLKFCQAAEIEGHSVQLTVAARMIGATNSGKTLTVSSCVKRYNEPLNLERLAAMSHIGYFRSFGFLCALTCSETITRTIGSVRPLNEQLPINIQNEIDSGFSKFIILNNALNFKEALHSIKIAVEQMK